jgi:hypothetical protein
MSIAVYRKVCGHGGTQVVDANDSRSLPVEASTTGEQP